MPILEHFGGPKAPVHCLAWVSDNDIEQLIAKAPAGTRFIFVQMDGNEALADKWLAKRRSFKRNN